MPEQRQNQETRDRLSKLIGDFDAERAAMTAYRRKVLKIVYGMVAAVLILGVVSVVQQFQNGDRAEENARAIRDIRKAQKASCAAEGVAFAGILVNTGLFLESASQLSGTTVDEKGRKKPLKDSKFQLADPNGRAWWASIVPTLTAVLDDKFSHPPGCGEKFTFTVDITGQDRRHVETGPTGPQK